MMKTCKNTQELPIAKAGTIGATEQILIVLDYNAY